MPARFRSCRSRRQRLAVCSRGSVQSSGPIHGRGETECAPVRLQRSDSGARKFDAGRVARADRCRSAPRILLRRAKPASQSRRCPRTSRYCSPFGRAFLLERPGQLSSRSTVRRPNPALGWSEYGRPSQLSRRLPSALRVFAGDRSSARRSHVVGGHTPEALLAVLGHAYLGGAPDPGACHNAFPCSSVNQLPNLTPSFLTPLTRSIPAAKSALRSPQSAASYARRRTAPRRRWIVPGARWRDSRCILYRTTTVLLNNNRGSKQYQSTNSSIACLRIRPS